VTRSALAVGCVALGLLFAGCGGSSDDEPKVAPAKDRSEEVADLKRQAKRLRAQAKRARRENSTPSAESPGAGDAEAGRFLAKLPGTAGLAVSAPGASGPAIVAGDFATGDAWSTIKVPIAERVLEDAGGPGGITADQNGQIHAAITLSDNDAAAALFESLEGRHGGLGGASKAVERMLRRAGDAQTVVSTVGRDGFSTYGQTDWSLADQATYMAALAGGCVGEAGTLSHLLGEMSAVGGSDTFGIGAAGYPAKWKGGWGPGTDGRYLVRQMGVMDVDGKQMVIAIAAIPDDGTFEGGGSMLSEIARWAAANLADRVPAPAGC